MRSIYTDRDVTHGWLCYLAKLPGKVWIEFRDNKMVIIHEQE